MPKRRIDLEAVAAARKKKQPLSQQERTALEWAWWDALVGSPIILKTVTAERVSGVLKWVGLYSVCIVVERDMEALILKNGILAVCPAGRPEEQSDPEPEPKLREKVDLNDMF